MQLLSAKCRGTSTLRTGKVFYALHLPNSCRLFWYLNANSVWISYLLTAAALWNDLSLDHYCCRVLTPIMHLPLIDTSTTFYFLILVSMATSPNFVRAFALNTKKWKAKIWELYSRCAAGLSNEKKTELQNNWHLNAWSTFSVRVWPKKRVERLVYQLSAESSALSASAKWPFRNDGFHRIGPTIHSVSTI